GPGPPGGEPGPSRIQSYSLDSAAGVDLEVVDPPSGVRRDGRGTEPELHVLPSQAGEVVPGTAEAVRVAGEALAADRVDGRVLTVHVRQLSGRLPGGAAVRRVLQRGTVARVEQVHVVEPGEGTLRNRHRLLLGQRDVVTGDSPGHRGVLAGGRQPLEAGLAGEQPVALELPAVVPGLEV